jgi:NDP-sugar pyrophosphorylase family protein
MSLPVAILTGGMATRLRPITEKIPKALVEVAGEPFVWRQLDYLRHQNIRDVVLCIGHLGEMIEAAVGDGSRFGLRVSYSSDGSALLGTGGALKKAAPLLGERFFVLYGDSFLPVDFGAVEAAFLASGKPALLTVLKNHNRWDKSNVLFVDGELVEYDKTNARQDFSHIDYGLGALKREVVNRYPADGPFDLAAVYRALSLAGQLHGYQVFERFYEIGSLAGLRETNEFFASDGGK